MPHLLTGQHVLVVEHYPDRATAIAQMIKQLGAETHRCASPDAARQLAGDLLRRYSKPAQMAIIGSVMPTSGKRQWDALYLLLQTRLIPASSIIGFGVDNAEKAAFNRAQAHYVQGGIPALAEVLKQIDTNQLQPA